MERCLRNAGKTGPPVDRTSPRAELTASEAGRCCDEQEFRALGGLRAYKAVLSSWGGRWQTGPMTNQPPSYRGYRFPREIISHAVWLYDRFGLSFRDVEDLLERKQSSRGLASTDPPAGAPDASVQVGRPFTTLRIGARRRPESLPGRPTSAAVGSPPAVAKAGVPRVGYGDVRLLIDK